MNEKSITIILPFLPCSVNKSYAWYKVRYKSNDYKLFEKEMIKAMSKIPKYEITWNKWLSVTYHFSFPLYYKNWNIRKRDVANFEKTLSDSLSHHIKWFKDEKIKEMRLLKHDSDKEESSIIIYEL